LVFKAPIFEVEVDFDDLVTVRVDGGKPTKVSEDLLEQYHPMGSALINEEAFLNAVKDAGAPGARLMSIRDLDPTGAMMLRRTTKLNIPEENEILTVFDKSRQRLAKGNPAKADDPRQIGIARNPFEGFSNGGMVNNMRRRNISGLTNLFSKYNTSGPLAGAGVPRGTIGMNVGGAVQPQLSSNARTAKLQQYFLDRGLGLPPRSESSFEENEDYREYLIDAKKDVRSNFGDPTKKGFVPEYGDYLQQNQPVYQEFNEKLKDAQRQVGAGPEAFAMATAPPPTAPFTPAPVPVPAEVPQDLPLPAPVPAPLSVPVPAGVPQDLPLPAPVPAPLSVPVPAEVPQDLPLPVPDPLPPPPPPPVMDLPPPPPPVMDLPPPPPPVIETPPPVVEPDPMPLPPVEPDPMPLPPVEPDPLPPIPPVDVVEPPIEIPLPPIEETPLPPPVYTPPPPTEVVVPQEPLFTPPPIAETPQLPDPVMLSGETVDFDIADEITPQTGGYATTQGMNIAPTGDPFADAVAGEYQMPIYRPRPAAGAMPFLSLNFARPSTPSDPPPPPQSENYSTGSYGRLEFAEALANYERMYGPVEDYQAPDTDAVMTDDTTQSTDTATGTGASTVTSGTRFYPEPPPVRGSGGIGPQNLYRRQLEAWEAQYGPVEDYYAAQNAAQQNDINVYLSRQGEDAIAAQYGMTIEQLRDVNARRREQGLPPLGDINLPDIGDFRP
jgi:hypothetical protein